jgi:hypothetical protein
MKKHLLILATALLSISTFSQIPNYVPANGLVGWWPFNGNANDESGNGNHGTVNGATLTADRFGNANMAYGFDGVDDWITISNLVTSNISGSYSVSIWLNSINNSLVFDGHEVISDRDANSFDFKFRIIFGISQMPYLSDTYLQTCSNGNTICSEVISTLPIINNWHNYVITYNHISNEFSGYKSGILIQTNSSVGFCSGNRQINLGRSISPSYPNGCSYFEGKIDDIGIWNRALTACEIQDLYHAQLGSQAISAGADQSICAGDNVTLSGAGGSNYQWNNNVVDGQAFTPNQSANYVLNGTDSLGCQGTDTVVVTVLENAVSTLTQTALDSYTLNGQTYTQSGTYTQTVPAANGCDSTITLNLTLNFTGMDELGTGAKKLVKITDLNGKIIPRRKNTLMLFIYEDGTVERVVEIEE